jgi:hypothetical protein
VLQPPIDCPRTVNFLDTKQRTLVGKCCEYALLSYFVINPAICNSCFKLDKSTVIHDTGIRSAPEPRFCVHKSEESGHFLPSLHIHAARMLLNSKLSWSKNNVSSTASPFRISMVGVCKRWRIHWSSSLSAAKDSALWRKFEMLVACSMARKVSTHSSTAGSMACLIAAYSVQ